VRFDFKLKANKIKIIFLTILSLVILLLIMRGPVVRMIVAKKTGQIEQRYGLVIDYKKLRFSGVAGIKLKSVRIYPLADSSDNTVSLPDTIFSADNVKFRVNPWKILFFKPDLKELRADNVKFNFIKRDSASNFNFLYRGHKKAPADSSKSDNADITVNYARVTERIFSLILGALPSEANINRLDINYVKDNYHFNIYLPGLKIEDDKFSVIVHTTEDSLESRLIVKGILDDSERKISARLFSEDKEKFSVPFLNYRWGADVKFDTLAFDMSASVRRSDQLNITGRAEAKGISVFHQKLSPENVILDRGEFEYKFNVGKNYIELDSVSVATINNFRCNPYLRFQKNEKWRVTASLNKKHFPADELFSSLPKGLFYNLEGLKAEGKLSYHFYLDIDFALLDSLKLESSLKREGFRINSFGNTDFRYVNGEFEYTAYENGVPVRTFPVGSSNPDFRTADRISPYLQMAVLQSEDGGFFYHNGFLIESIREALAQDIKEHRFRRGGSTISMQLVKNVFLSRHKTLARKFEEIMIVWLIETNRLCSKERMFEIYMNIIEWGPMVYGANEAAHFYFDKEAKDININEAIFLASIIPSPKRALSSFTDDYQLKPTLEGYYRLLAQRFRVKGLIDEQQESLIRPEVKLGNEAKRLIRERQPVADSSDFNLLQDELF
jgi:hypothetical protein